MNKIISWVLGLTKVGAFLDKVRGVLSGKKAYLAGAALAVPALVTIITKFAEQGVPYILSVTGTEEFKMLMEGLGIMGLRAGIAKSQ